MTCSLLRSRTAVTVVVQDWPFRAPILPSRRDSSRAQLAHHPKSLVYRIQQAPGYLYGQ